MAQVTLNKVVKRFDDVYAVAGIDLEIADSEFVVLFVEVIDEMT